MRRALLAALFVLGLGAPRAAAQVETGIDVLEQGGFAELKGRRIGLITNQTGIDRAGRSDVDVLAAAPGVTLVGLFTPEHGFTGGSESNRIEDGSLVVNGRKIPIHSLYKGGIAGMKPTPEEMAGLDALVFDIQDIGTRFYTYMASMALAIEAARDKGIDFFVLDRPNPIGGEIMEGPVLDDYLAYRKVTPTAYFPEPVRHAMTAGEIATMYAAELGYPRLRVIRLRHWSRAQWFDETGLPSWDNDKARRPSPNIPDLTAATLYPGLGLFEPANLSIGRGIEGSQFRLVGAPWLDAAKVLAKLESRPLPGVAFAVEDFTPGLNPEYPYYGQLCHGLRLSVTDRKKLRPLAVFLALAQAVRDVHPDKLKWRWDSLTIMSGLKDAAALYARTPDLRQWQSLFDSGAAAFAASRASFLLY